MEPRSRVQARAIPRRPERESGGEEREFHSLLRWQTIVSRRAFGTRGALSLSRGTPADIQVRGFMIPDLHREPESDFFIFLIVPYPDMDPLKIGNTY